MRRCSTSHLLSKTIRISSHLFLIFPFLFNRCNPCNVLNYGMRITARKLELNKMVNLLEPAGAERLTILFCQLPKHRND